MSFISPMSFGMASPYAAPLFEGDKGKRRSSSRGPANNAPEVTANQRKKHRVGDVVQFSTGRYELKLVSGKGLAWVSTHKEPSARTYKINK